MAGLYHLTCLGMTTWYDFAKAILKTASIAVPVERMLTQDLDRPALRPINSRLDCSLFIRLSQYWPRHWEEAMAAYLKNRLI
jgi:dTDP-4-dehydrorhamnose reductase